MRKSEILKLLENKDFKYLWGNQILTQFAYNFVNFGLMVLTYQSTKSNFAVALLILTIIIPTAIFATFSGVISDFFDRRKIMLLVNILWGFLVLGFIFINDNILHVLTLSFIINTVDRFFTPAQQASLSVVVPPPYLLLANSLFSITINAALIIGLSLAGPVMILLGDQSLFLIAAFLAFLAAFFVYLMPPISVNHTQESALKIILDNTFSAIKDGYSFILKKRLILTGIIFLTGLQICANTAISLGPGYAEKILKADTRHASIIFALPLGAGSFLGIYLITLWQKKILKRLIVQRGLILSSLGILILGLGPVINGLFFINNEKFFALNYSFFQQLLLGFSFLASFLLGVSFSLMNIPTYTILAEKTPKELLGRVWGVVSMFQNTIAAFPLIVIGFLADRISIVPITFLFAIIPFLGYTLTKKKSLEVFFYG